MTDKKKVDSNRLERGAAFMSAVLDAAKLYDIPPSIVFAIFGRIGKAAVEATIESGLSAEESTMAVISSFMKGLGMQEIHDPDEPPSTKH